MATTKVTFTLDDVTVNRIREAAARLSLPKSQVVREAVQEYYERTGRLSEAEKQRMLRVLDEMMSRPPTRPQEEVDKELRAIRRARRGGGRRTRIS
jgi:predicted transcriptional regulator